MIPRFALANVTASDHAAFVRLFAELGVPDPTPSEPYFARIIAPQAICAREGDEVLGYAWARPRGERLHVVHVVTDPAHRRRGVARALMGALSQRARAAGFRRWMLNVKPENGAARALYVGCGMRVALESVSLRLAWSDLARLPPAPARTTTCAIASSDDSRFEHALGLSVGDLSTCRQSPGRVFLGAAVDGSPVACVAFDPLFPGAPLLRVRSPDYARPVLEGLVPHAGPRRESFFVFVEGDPALESVLVGAGAEVSMRALRMEGEI